MSSPGPIPDLNAKDPANIALHKILTIRQSEIAVSRDAFLHERGREQSRKCVHNLRVSLRRKQAFLNIFHDSLPRKKATNVRKYTRKGLRALGPIREQDVFIALLRQYALTIESDSRTGIFLLVSRIQYGRDHDVKMLRGDIESILGKSWESECTILLKKLETREPDSEGDTSSVPFRQVAADTLSSHVKELIADGERIVVHSDGTGLHDLRVDAKPVRYILETLQHTFPNLGDFYGEVKRFVGLLGELHDGELLLPLIARHSGELKVYGRQFTVGEGTHISTKGLTLLEEDILKRREVVLKDIRGILRRWKRESAAGAIRKTILA